MSTSATVVTCAAVRRLRTMCSAIWRRMAVSGWRNSRLAPGGCGAALAPLGLAPAAGSGCGSGCAVGWYGDSVWSGRCACGPASMNASTSCFRMRPPVPVPVTCERSTPCSSATRLTTGEITCERSGESVAPVRPLADERASVSWGWPGWAPVSILASGVPTVDGLVASTRISTTPPARRRRDLRVDLVGGDVAHGLVCLDPVTRLLAPGDDRALGDRHSHLRHRHRRPVSVCEELMAPPSCRRVPAVRPARAAG